MLQVIHLYLINQRPSFSAPQGSQTPPHQPLPLLRCSHQPQCPLLKCPCQRLFTLKVWPRPASNHGSPTHPANSPPSRPSRPSTPTTLLTTTSNEPSTSLSVIPIVHQLSISIPSGNYTCTTSQYRHPQLVRLRSSTALSLRPLQPRPHHGVIKAQACDTNVSHLAPFVGDRFDYKNTKSPLARQIYKTATMSEQDGTGAAAPGDRKSVV